MSKDMLSQEEIDALLRANALEDEEGVDEVLTDLEQDTLGEIGNIAFGSSATALSTLLNQKVDITTPTVTLVKRSQLSDEFPRPHVAVHVEYTDGFSGINMLVIKTDDAAAIADLMMGGEGKPESSELSELSLSAVQEAMNQMMGSAATSMSTIFNKFVNISPPSISVMDLASGVGQENLPEEETFVKISFRLKVGEQGELIDSTIMQLVPISFAKQMVRTLMGADEAAASAVEAPAEATASQSEPQPQPETPPAQPVSERTGQPYGQPAVPPYAAAPGNPQAPYPYPPYYPPYPPQAPYPGHAYPQTPGPDTGTGAIPPQSAHVQSAQFSPFSQPPVGAAEQHNLGLLLDIPLQVSVELGRTKKLIKEILELSSGSIIQLDKLAGEPVDILVNNKLVAKGEVVVIDENFGVRITDIISQWERVQKLQ